MIREVTVKEYPGDSGKTNRGLSHWVNLRFSAHDGGWHGRDTPCWRNMSPEDAIELGKDLMIAGLRAQAGLTDQD